MDQAFPPVLVSVQVAPVPNEMVFAATVFESTEKTVTLNPAPSKLPSVMVKAPAKVDVKASERVSVPPGALIKTFSTATDRRTPSPKKMNVAVLEGPWDGMRLEEELRKYRNNQGKAVRTTDTEQSLFSQWNVIALPGVDVFREDWIPLFKGKTVAWLFDNDHPRLNVKTGEVLEPPGLKGALKNAKMVSKVVKSQQIIRWGVSELLDQELPDGFDVRDFLSSN
jgi:hypothetical protein